MGHTSAVRFYDGAEAGETPTDTLARALHHLELGHRRLRSEFAATLGLTNSEFNALTHVGHAREVTPKELSISLHMTTGAVTAMIDRLENAGLVSRRNNPSDRRSLLVGPTERGYEVLDWVVERYQGTIEKIVANEAELLHPVFAELLLSAARSMREEADGLARTAASR